MEVTRLRALRGPNLWSHHTAIQAIVSCNAAEHAVDKIDGFEVRLRARFPEIGSFQPTGQDNSIAIPTDMKTGTVGLQGHLETNGPVDRPQPNGPRTRIFSPAPLPRLARISVPVALGHKTGAVGKRKQRISKQGFG